jgi:hypothetical protein
VKKVYLCMAWSPGSSKIEACNAFSQRTSESRYRISKKSRKRIANLNDQK